MKNLKAVKLKREGNLLTKKNKRRILLLKDDDKKKRKYSTRTRRNFSPLSLSLSLSLFDFLNLNRRPVGQGRVPQHHDDAGPDEEAVGLAVGLFHFFSEEVERGKNR